MSQSRSIVSLLQHIAATCESDGYLLCVQGALSSGLAKKKRKKLHGLVCKESRCVLEEVNETLGD